MAAKKKRVCVLASMDEYEAIFAVVRSWMQKKKLTHNEEFALEKLAELASNYEKDYILPTI